MGQAASRQPRAADGGMFSGIVHGEEKKAGGNTSGQLKATAASAGLRPSDSRGGSPYREPVSSGPVSNQFLVTQFLVIQFLVIQFLVIYGQQKEERQ